MKRLLAQIGITYFSVLAAAFYLSDTAVILVGAGAVVLAFVFFCIRKIRAAVYLPVMAVTAAVACLVQLGYTYAFVQPVVERYAGGEHAFTAVLTEEPYQSYHQYYYRLKTVTIDGEQSRVSLLLSSSSPLDIEPDETIAFSAVANSMDNRYYQSKGYFLYIDCDDPAYTVTKPAHHSWWYYTISLRKLFRTAFDELLPEDCAALCRAILIGDKYALDVSVKESFRYAGASYFIVVSGMHFAVISMLLLKLLKHLRGRWLRFAVMTAFLLLYMAITGFQPSVMRSGIMVFAAALGLTIRRQAYPLNHLGLAGIATPTLLSPYAAGDIGLILSFYVTLAILLWADPITKKICLTDSYGNPYRFQPVEYVKQLRQRRNDNRPAADRKLLLKKLYNSFASVIAISLAANILIFPITVWAFQAFSLVTLLSSVLLYPAIYLILVLSLSVSVLFLLSPLRYAASALSWPLYALCRYVLWVVGVLGGLPFSYIHIGARYVYLWLGITLLLGICVLLYRNRYRYLPYAALGSVVILLAGMLTGGLLSMHTLYLEVYQCGAGLCAGINSGGRLYLISMDANRGERYTVLNDLSDRYGGAALALCADDTDYSVYSDYANREFAISRYLLYDREEYDFEIDGVTGFSADSTFLLEDDLTLTVTVCGDTVIPYITAAGKTILVIPQDCALTDIPEHLRHPDVIILTRAFDGADQLGCTDMVISDVFALSLITAEELQGCYDKVYVTCEGNVRLDLR